jgi:hypothetical protein
MSQRDGRWTEEQDWAKAAWAEGRKIIKVVGYDIDEDRRVKKAQSVSWKPELEEQRFGYWYPLFDLGLSREDCEELIAEAGFPPAHKSACTFCPSNSEDEWIKLRDKEPGRFAEAVAMSRQAQIDSPDVVGLMRCYPHGKRQLHVWADAGCPRGGARDVSDDVPCECAT